MTETDNTTQQIKKSLQESQLDPPIKGVFNSMVQNFAQQAHINDPIRPGMVLHPKV